MAVEEEIIMADDPDLGMWLYILRKALEQSLVATS
jgi:hypothetical protein